MIVFLAGIGGCVLLLMLTAFASECVNEYRRCKRMKRCER